MLAIEEIRYDESGDREDETRYVREVTSTLRVHGLAREILITKSRLQRTSPDDPEYLRRFGELAVLEQTRRGLLEQGP